MAVDTSKDLGRIYDSHHNLKKAPATRKKKKFGTSRGSLKQTINAEQRLHPAQDLSFQEHLMRAEELRAKYLAKDEARDQ